MTVAQINAILALLNADEDKYGYIFFVSSDLFYSTHDYLMEIETIGGVSTLVCTSKWGNNETTYVNVGSIVSVKQNKAPKRFSKDDLTPVN